jgi:Zn-dependent metalloprotease
MVRGHLGRATRPIVDVDDVAASMSSALPPIAAKFGVNADTLVPTRVQHDELGMTHVRYEQRKNGMRVVGGDFVVHLASDRVVVSANGSVRDGGDMPVDARISIDTAREIARGATADGNVDVSGSELLYVINSNDGAMHLAWEVLAVGRDGLLLEDLVYVDATSGNVVERRPQVFTARNREIRNGNNCSYPFSCGTTQVVGTEMSPPTGDAVALAAFTNTGATYDCYQALFGRDSYDGAGAKLTSLVHVVFSTGQGTTGNNAAWAGNRMVYGDGDGQMMGPLANSLDVTAHELTHGVTSATAKLVYQNEPGALNEGISDIMAAVCEAWKDGAVTADTWLVGEDIFTPNTAGDALRYMANPTLDASLYPASLGGSRDYYPERYQGTQDNGGVHLNSGIPNLAFQLLVAGGKHPRNKTTFNVPGIGITKAGAIFQRALTQGYFTSNTNLAQARTQTEMVASQLYPGATVTAVSFAWAAVGVGMPPAVNDTTAPTVSITSPTDGATVDAGFMVTVQAMDDMAVDRVELSVDGAVVGTDNTAPYEFATDASLAPGSHSVTATAYDLFNQASATINVTIASGGACTTSDDCQGDEQCKDGACVAPTGCAVDTDCASGESCTGGICVPQGGNETGDGGGCGCAAGPDRGGLAAGNLLLLLGTLVLIGRRRR